MGKHLDIYGKKKDKKYRQVPLVFPVADESAMLHRPSTDEVDEIKVSYQSKTEHVEIWKATYVMKFLCDEPNLRDADDVELFNEVRGLEAPDRMAILNVWQGLQGSIPDNLKDMFASELFRGLSKEKA